MTLILLKFVGVFFLVMAVSILLNQKIYKKLMKDLCGEPNTQTLMFGFVAFIVGLPFILMHNKWNNLNQIIVSLWGWSAFIKGVMILCLPDMYRNICKSLNSESYLKTKGVVCLALGLYISYLAFMG